MHLSELETILGQAVRLTGSRVGVENAEFYSVDEIRELVKQKHAQVSEPLESFVNSYWQWFDFHRRIEAQGKEGNLDQDEHGQLAELVKQRNQTRQQLLAVLPPAA